MIPEEKFYAGGDKVEDCKDKGKKSEVSQKEKHKYSILMHIYGIYKDGNDNPVYETAKETLMYRTVLWTLWERVGRFGRMALKHVKCHV